MQPDAATRDGTHVVGASGNGNRPRWYLIAISQADAADRSTSVLGSPTVSRVGRGNRSGVVSIHNQACVSTSTLM